MEDLRDKPAFKAVAVLLPIVAVSPIVLGLHGGWIALHLIGGALSLAVLIYCGVRLPSPWRWLAAAGVVISLVTISVITSGGAIGPAIQVVMLVLLAAIYLMSVFWPHRSTGASY
jgi:hypothetical protein